MAVHFSPILSSQPNSASVQPSPPGPRAKDVFTKVQLVRPGAGRNPGKMINYLAEGSANDPHVTSFIPAYKVVSGLYLDSNQIHARCILLDTKT